MRIPSDRGAGHDPAQLLEISTENGMMRFVTLTRTMEGWTFKPIKENAKMGVFELLCGYLIQKQLQLIIT